MDVDGVLTDGGMYYSETGEVMKKFNTKDGVAVELLRKHGIVPAIITQEDSLIVLKRAEKLKIDEVHVGVKDKPRVVKEIAEKHGLGYDEIAYIGDDINDAAVLREVGFAIAVADAIEDVKGIANYVTERRGGEGAVREAVDFLIKTIEFAEKSPNYTR